VSASRPTLHRLVAQHPNECAPSSTDACEWAMCRHLLRNSLTGSVPQEVLALSIPELCGSPAIAPSSREGARWWHTRVRPALQATDHHVGVFCGGAHTAPTPATASRLRRPRARRLRRHTSARAGAATRVCLQMPPCPTRGCARATRRTFGPPAPRSRNAAPGVTPPRGVRASRGA
jgi:hypothetical protein